MISYIYFCRVWDVVNALKISEYIKSSLDSVGRMELEQAMMFVCMAVDGTAKKEYPNMPVGSRFRKFINNNLEIVELMFGGINLQETRFPLKNKKGMRGMTFAEIVYEKYRCNLAHGEELPDGYGISIQIAAGCQQFNIDIANNAMTLPQSVIYALGLICVLAPVNADQKIGSYTYWYSDPINKYVIDRWWGQLDCAKKIMNFDEQIRVKLDFSNVFPIE